MNVLLYTKMLEGPGKQLQAVIETLVQEKGREIYRTVDSLSRRLRRPKNCPTIAVILTASREDLIDILSIRDLLCDIRTILILPDRKEDTIAKGHIMRPRFLSYIDSDLGDVAIVLAKMLHQIVSPVKTMREPEGLKGIL